MFGRTYVFEVGGTLQRGRTAPAGGLLAGSWLHGRTGNARGIRAFVFRHVVTCIPKMGHARAWKGKQAGEGQGRKAEKSRMGGKGEKVPEAKDSDLGARGSGLKEKAREGNRASAGSTAAGGNSNGGASAGGATT